MGPLSGMERGFGWKQVTAESHHTNAGKRQSPSGEKYRTGVKQKRIDHRKSSGGARRREAPAPFDRTLCHKQRGPRAKDYCSGAAGGA
jgi:hypothetical protein